MGGDVYPSVDSTVHLPGRGPLHNHIRRHPTQEQHEHNEKNIYMILTVLIDLM